MIATGPSLLCDSDVSVADLVLRVRGPGRVGQLVRLRSAKCSIGSDARCTLRVQARGVQPVHCVIFRGEARTIIRRWAPDTRLNGSAFADAELCPGDTLSVGPVELEVLETRALPLGREMTRSSTATKAPETEDLDEEKVRLRERQQDFERREQAFLQERAQWEAERADFQCQREELVAERERLTREQAEWHDQRQAAEETLAERESEAEQAAGASRDLARQREELVAERERLTREQAEWSSRQQAAEETLAERERQLEQRRIAMEAQIAAQEAQENCRAAEECLHDGQPDDDKGDVSAPELEDAATDEDDAGSDVAKEDRKESPIDLADVLRRLGKADLLTDDDCDMDVPQPDQAEPSRPQPQAAEDSSKPASNDPTKSMCDGPDSDEEVSVDEYMSQLLRRVRGVPEQQDAQGCSKNPCEEMSEDSASRSEKSDPPVSPRAVERKVRGPAPERSGFTAMRELANISARSAVDHHVRRQMVGISRSKLAVVLTASLAGLVLLWLWNTYAPIGVTLLAATTSFMIAVLWATQYAVVTGRLLVGKNGCLTIKRHDEPTARDADTDTAAAAE